MWIYNHHQPSFFCATLYRFRCEIRVRSAQCRLDLEMRKITAPISLEQKFLKWKSWNAIVVGKIRKVMLICKHYQSSFFCATLYRFRCEIRVRSAQCRLDLEMRKITAPISLEQKFLKWKSWNAIVVGKIRKVMLICNHYQSSFFCATRVPISMWNMYKICTLSAWLGNAKNNCANMEQIFLKWNSWKRVNMRTWS